MGDIDKKLPDISEVQNKILDTSGLVTTTVLNTKIGEVENKVPDHAKYIATSEFNKLTADNFPARLKQADLVNRTDFYNKQINFKRKIISNKAKYLEIQKKLTSLMTKDCNFYS